MPRTRKSRPPSLKAKSGHRGHQDAQNDSPDHPDVRRPPDAGQRPIPLTWTSTLLRRNARAVTGTQRDNGGCNMVVMTARPIDC